MNRARARSIDRVERVLAPWSAAVALLLLLAPAAPAQRLPFNTYDADDGLTGTQISDLRQDRRGLHLADPRQRLELRRRRAVQIERRLRDRDYAERFATLELERRADRVEFTITDMGAGFDWHAYLELHPSRVMDLHGRGIAIARRVCFEELRYQGWGNVVTAVKRL